MKRQIRYQGLKFLEPHRLEQLALTQVLFNQLAAFNQKSKVFLLQADIDNQLILNRVMLEYIEPIGDHGIAILAARESRPRALSCQSS